jgi:hypothetical protein
MLKLKKIYLLKKIIKSTINQNTDVVTTKLKEILLVLRRRGIFFGGGCL